MTWETCQAWVTPPLVWTVWTQRLPPSALDRLRRAGWLRASWIPRIVGGGVAGIRPLVSGDCVRLLAGLARAPVRRPLAQARGRADQRGSSGSTRQRGLDGFGNTRDANPSQVEAHEDALRRRKMDEENLFAVSDLDQV